MKRKTLVVLLLLLPAMLFADTFTVTSNADSGPGTLREALQKANDNGITQRDSIIFNLPAEVSARTISTQGTLVLSSNLVIDGSSEPAPAFGVSGAKIRITTTGSCSPALNMYQLTDVAIYGLWISDFNITTLSCFGGAITITSCKNFRLGAPFKGNVFSNDFYGVAPNGDFFVNDSTPSEDIIVQANFFGLDTLGNNDKSNNSSGMSTGVARNITIGGEGPGEGNYFGQGGLGVGDPYNQPKHNGGYVKMINNSVGINYSKTDYNMGGQLSVSGHYTNNTDFDITVKGNIFGIIGLHTSLWIQNVTGNINIENNNFGQPIVNNAFIYGDQLYAIIIQVTNKKDHILIHNNTVKGYHSGIELDGVLGATITDNSIFCTQKGIAYNIHTLGVPVISIKQITANTISGKTVPNGKVQIFYTDECQEFCENGQNLLANVTADNAGNFTYNGPVHGLISATVTDSYGTTSEFNGVKADVVDAYVKNATCGNNNGTITNVKILNASSWYWEDAAGNKVSTDTNLVNLAPGKYRIVLRESNVNCDLISGYYEVLAEARPKFDSSFTLSQPTCRQANGEIHFTGTNSDGTYNSWRDSTGKGMLYYTNDITGIAPGKYYYRLALYDDSTCYVQRGPLVLVNQKGPSINTDAVQITNATCGNSNGSIKNITYKDVAPNGLYLGWENLAGNPWGNITDENNVVGLINIPAGIYRLRLKDGSGCDTVITRSFAVTNEGAIAYDTSKMIVTAASCTGAKGSIKQITSTGATTFAWINTAGGNTVGSNQDITGVPAGSYRLAFGNNYGCGDTTNVITVKQQIFLTDTVTRQAIYDANCDLNNGYINALGFTRDTSLYHFEWLDGAGNILSTHTDVYNLAPGAYTLYATDPNGCRQAVYSATLTQQHKPVLVYDNVILGDDTCNAGKGFIQNLATQEKPLNYTWAWFAANGQQVGNMATSISGLQAGGYYATVTDTYNCIVTSNTFTLNNTVQPQAAPQVADQYIQRGATATLTVANPQTGMYYLYDTITATVPANSSASGILTTPPVRYDKRFYVQYVSGDCESPRTPVLIKVFDSTMISIPNAFSPNGDGINDTWRIQVRGAITNYALTIFNRYGQNVFTSSDVNTQWNGTLNGKPVPAGTYYYILQGRGESNRPVKISGYVVVLR